MPSVPRQLWSITFRPRNGVSDAQIETFIAHIAKYPQAFAVTEKKDDARHIHAGIMVDTPWLQGNIRNTFLRLFVKDLDDKEKKVALIVKHWYNLDWYEQYCDKNDDTVSLYDNINPDDLPFAEPDDKQDARPVSAWYRKMEKQLLEDTRFKPPYTEETCLAFLNTLQNLDRTIEVIPDPKQLQQKTRALKRFVEQYDGSTYSNKRIRTETQENTAGFVWNN